MVLYLVSSGILIGFTYGRIYFLYDRKLLASLSVCAWKVMNAYLKVDFVVYIIDLKGFEEKLCIHQFFFQAGEAKGCFVVVQGDLKCL